MMGRGYQVLICILFGHQNEQITLQLGKIIAEPVKGKSCKRCGRISLLLKSESAFGRGEDPSDE